MQMLLLPGLTRDSRRSVWLQELACRSYASYPIPGCSVCYTAYELLRGVSATRRKDLINELASKTSAGGTVNTMAPAAHGLMGQRRVSTKAKAAVSFLLGMVEMVGDTCPVTGNVHVFMFKCPLTLYGMFVNECMERGVGEFLSQRGFYMLFEKGSLANKLICHIRWKRQVTQKLCSTCGGLALERSELMGQRVPQGAPQWESWLLRKTAHITLIGTERRLYHELRADLRAGRKTGVTLYIMDASKPLRHPRRLFDSDLARSIPQIPGAFIGLIDHSTLRATLFLSAAPGIRVEHQARAATAKQKARTAGSSFTWESTDVNGTLLISSILNDYHEGCLQKHLHLQVDGGSDARGFVVVMMLGVLCTLGVIERATIASLIPGHTHEDIDGLFSVLSKALKCRAGEHVCRSWTEIWKCALRVYPGWSAPTEKKPGPTGVSEIHFVWKLKEVFGQGSGFGTRPCLHPGLSGLFGAGKNHAEKPSRFEIALGENGLPVISAFLSSLPQSPLYSKFDRLPIFQYCPQLERLGLHDLSIGWERSRLALLEALEKSDHYGCGYTQQQVADMKSMACNFISPPEGAVFFGLDPSATSGWQKLLSLGHAPERRRRGEAASDRPAKRRGGRKDQNVEDEDADEGLAYVEEGDSEADEPGLEDTDEEEEEEHSVVDANDPRYVIEAWLDRRLEEDEEEFAYLLKYEGFEEPEWTLSRRINCAIPGRVEERFDSRDATAAEEERQARKKSAFRATANLLAGGDDDGEVEVRADLPVLAAAAAAAPAPAPALVPAPAPAPDNGRAHLRRNAAKKMKK
jgi:hypothetical protein